MYEEDPGDEVDAVLVYKSKFSDKNVLLYLRRLPKGTS
jgi:hypothetical protein